MELLIANKKGIPKGFNGEKWDTMEKEPPRKKDMNFYFLEN